jgi:hypothetical protein
LFPQTFKQPVRLKALLLKNISRIPIFAAARKPFDSAVRHIVLFERRRTTAAGVPMRNHDFVSDGFLAIIAASLLLLCSGLLAIAFS